MCKTGLDAAPVIQNNRTLLPIRAIVEAFGGTIEWHAELRVVTMYLNDHEVSLQIGNGQGYVNGVQTAIDVSDSKVVPIIMSGRTLLPLRRRGKPWTTGGVGSCHANRNGAGLMCRPH